MPAGSMGFAEVNVAEVIASPLWTAFDSEEAAGRREEFLICGVDPLEVVEDVSVGWVRQEASLEAVVVFMRADIPLVPCNLYGSSSGIIRQGGSDR